jgi:ABC-type antimicrobial peptide transport system permease subunit
VALGAQRSNVLSLILGHGALLAAAGIGIGLAGALAVTRFLRAMLYGVSPFDPTSFVAVTLLLSAIVFVASYVPARRAARVDPVDALRQE